MAKRQKTTKFAQAASRNKVGQSHVPEVADYDDGSADDTAFSRPATPRVIDFIEAERQPDPSRRGRFIDGRPETLDGKVMTPKQVRARARRAIAKGRRIPVEEQRVIHRPVEDWDMEELARGRPRAADGSFRGRKPSYVTTEMHEKAMENFRSMVRSEMNGSTVDALLVLTGLLNNDETDRRGKPVVSPSTKADVAKWMVEHVLGKAVQPTTTDISAKLQLILGAAMVNPAEVDMPAELEGYAPGHIGSRGGPADRDDFDDDEDDIMDADVIDWGDDD